MTQREQKVLADLVEAAKDATGYFNMKAQARDTGLQEWDDNLRQKLCNAVSAATGQVICGNLQRTNEAQQAIDNLNTLEGPAPGKVWALFSISNDYDQPRNNLVTFWTAKPLFEDFCKVFDVDVAPGMRIFEALQKYGNLLNDIRQVYNGQAVQVYGRTEYRLEHIEEGVKLEGHD